MSLEMKRISAAMGIGEDLNNAIAIISLQSVSVVMIFSLVIQGCVEVVDIFLIYLGNDILGVHLPHRQGPEEYVFDGGIGEFGNHKDESFDNLN